MFDDDKLYQAGDAALDQIAPYQTLAHWRMQRRGPPFHKIGRRVCYAGRDLNQWLADQRVEPDAAA